jgi:hypothetical protein
MEIEKDDIFMAADQTFCSDYCRSKYTNIYFDLDIDTDNLKEKLNTNVFLNSLVICKHYLFNFIKYVL